MANEDVQVVREAWTAWLRDGPEAIVPYLHPDVEWTPPQDEPDSATHRRHADVLALLRSWLEAFAEFRADLIEFTDLGDQVLISVVYCARAHGVDAEIETREVHVVAVTDGKVAEVRGYRTVADAERSLRNRF